MKRQFTPQNPAISAFLKSTVLKAKVPEVRGTCPGIPTHHRLALNIAVLIFVFSY